VKDKLFGLPSGKLQDVQVSNGQRRVTEEFLVADLLRYLEGFPEPFFIWPVFEWD
jgi:hypothetical protein